MKCLACDCILTESEDRRKFASGERVGLCNRDAAYVNVPMENGDDITPVDDPIEWDEEEYDDESGDFWRPDEPIES